MDYDKRFGSHISIKNGLSSALETAEKLGFHSLQLFTKNATRWTGKDPEKKDIDKFITLASNGFFHIIVAHASYLINPASANKDILEKSLNSLQDELNRCSMYHIPFYVIHPGSHMGEGEEKGLEKVVETFNNVRIPQDLTILLETTAGQGTNLGYRFEHLAFIIKNVKEQEHFAVCYDTCHTFAAGYDISNKIDFEKVFSNFDKIIGLSMIKAFHINDSKFPLDSKKDRHENPGKGYIGKDAFKLLINFQPFSETPMLLETEKSEDYHEDIENIKFLQSLLRKTKK